MNNRCIAHNQHHCVHAHECTNPLHQKMQESQSKSLANNGNKKTSFNKPLTNPIATCKSGTLLKQPPIPSVTKRDKEKGGDQNEKGNRVMWRTVSPDCKNLEFQKMFLNINQKYNQLLKELEGLKREKEVMEERLKKQTGKNEQLEMELQKKQSLLSNYSQQQSQLQKLKEVKRTLSASQNKSLALQSQIAKLKHTIQLLTSQKQRLKNQSHKNAKKVDQIEDEYQKQNRQKQNLRRKLQESQTTIDQLQSQYRSLASKNKLSMNDIIDDYQKRLRLSEQKFSFSCDQINEHRKTEIKLKSKIKQLEEQLHSQKIKSSSKVSRPAGEHTKVEKELIVVQDKLTKENQKLRERIIEYENDKRKLEQELSRTNTKLTEEIRQLEKLLKVKDGEIENLENVKLMSEKEVGLLRENKEKREKERQKREDELRKIGRDINDDNNKSNPKDKSQINPSIDPNNPNNPESFGIRGTYSQAIAIRHFQHRNAQLQRQVQQLLLLKSSPSETISINNYNEFEKVIAENNQHIKSLIYQKVKQIQSNSKLKVEILELKNQLATRSSSITSTHPHEISQEHRFRQIANYKNTISQLQFQLKQIKNENYDINNKYSDYYILRDDNEELKIKVRELADLVETLKKAVLHNSYQKEALIVESRDLADQLNLVSLTRPRY